MTKEMLSNKVVCGFLYACLGPVLFAFVYTFIEFRGLAQGAYDNHFLGIVPVLWPVLIPLSEPSLFLKVGAGSLLIVVILSAFTPFPGKPPKSYVWSGVPWAALVPLYLGSVWLYSSWNL